MSNEQSEMINGAMIWWIKGRFNIYIFPALKTTNTVGLDLVRMQLCVTNYVQYDGCGEYIELHTQH